jgi:predicted membrane protein
LVFRRSASNQDDFQINEGKQFNQFAVFSEQKQKITSQEFSNGEITAIFGSCKIDLTAAEIKNPPARIQTTALFGGGDLLIPTDWDVRNEVVALFGGVDHKRRHNTPAKAAPDLIITGTVLFGGLTIKS